jgi:ubiquinone biosynthesis protein
MTLEGVVRTLAPQMEILSRVQPYLEKVLRARWAPERVLKDVQAQAAEVFQAVRSYPINLAEILQRVAEGRLRIESHLQNTERLERRLKELATRVPLALLVCALLVSSSILLYSNNGGGSLKQTLGILGYAGALVVILRMFLKL